MRRRALCPNRPRNGFSHSDSSSLQSDTPVPPTQDDPRPLDMPQGATILDYLLQPNAFVSRE